MSHRGQGGRRRRALLLGAAALAALAGLLSGCTGDGDATPSGEEPADATVAASPAAGAGEQEAGAAAPSSSAAGFNPRAIYAKASLGVVTVRSVFGAADSLGGGGGQGSGFVISADGEIVTNAHVVTDAGNSAVVAEEINQADEVYVEFYDSNQVPAEVVGVDPNADIALLRVEPEGLDLNPLELGDSDAVAVGAPVAAIGSPFGQEQSLSTGIVSGTDRSIASLTSYQIDRAIQTDASINPGNSGGPLIGPGGLVVGVNQQINTTSGGNEGVGFAVPSNLVQRSIDDLRDDGNAEYAFIGVETRSLYPQLAERLGIDAPAGALIIAVSEGSPAEEAGLRGADSETISFQGQQLETGGDVIVAIEGEKLIGENDLSRLITERRPGEEIEVEVLRDGERRTFDVTLRARADNLS